LHKFLFHFEGHSTATKRFIYAIHGAHHDYPNDPQRLVVPLAVSIPALFIFYFFFKTICGPVNIDIFMASLVAIYLVYDTNHYMSHNGNWKNSYFQKMKKHHLRHHFSDPKKDFGFTTKLWDRVFRSLS
jgi:sterol desaturase/sphingolipid hydroxylase (fatty acid hydroxylase superfamily)